MEPSKKPLNVLTKKLNNEVGVKLKNNVEYRGVMIDCDSHMNVILQGAVEYNDDKPTANFGDVILRGSNILYIRISFPT